MEQDPDSSPFLLGEAHRRSQRLVETLDRQRREMEEHPPELSAEQLAQGREAMEKAMASARRLLKNLEEAMRTAADPSDKVN